MSALGASQARDLQLFARETGKLQLVEERPTQQKRHQECSLPCRSVSWRRVSCVSLSRGGSPRAQKFMRLSAPQRETIGSRTGTLKRLLLSRGQQAHPRQLSRSAVSKRTPRFVITARKTEDQHGGPQRLSVRRRDAIANADYKTLPLLHWKQW